MKYLSLFSGIGGFELGIEYAISNLRPNELADSKRPTELHGTADKLQQWQCVGFSEIDKYAIQIYERHFKHKNYEDIRTINTSELPDFDLLVGGFPCQSFSIAGKRKGFDDTRGTLFFEIAKILKDKQPRLFCLENVKGLLSHDNGQTFRTIIRTLDELGYDLQWQVLNSKNFGVPQNRERVFIIGHLRGTSRPKVFPVGRNDTEYVKSLKKEQGSRKGIRVSDYAGALRAKETKSGCDTVIDEGDLKIRRLTPTECMRLQGFPDHWCDYGLEYLTPEEYNKDYDDATKTNPIEVLSLLQETVSPSLRERWGFAESFALLKNEILQQGMYEKSVQGSLEKEPTHTSRSLASKAISDCDRMWEMWLKEKSGYSPQGQKHTEQLFIQFRGSLSELSQPGTPKAKINLISDCQSYKCLGNAVTVNVIESIMSKLLI